MRLSLLSDDGDVAELLITKAMELMSQAESAAAAERQTALHHNGHRQSHEDEPQ
jgi:hypothetical protein